MTLRTRILLIALIFPASCNTPIAFAQSEQWFFSDSYDAYSCNLAQQVPALFTVYVLHRTQGAVSVTFAAPMPLCMTGATYLQDSSPYGGVSGNSQTGVTVNYGQCLVTGQGAALVMTINYFTDGTTLDCCPYDAVPFGEVPYEGCLMYEDCTGAVKPTGIDQQYRPFINRNGSCECFLSSDWTSPDGVNVLPADGAVDVPKDVFGCTCFTRISAQSQPTAAAVSKTLRTAS